MKPLLNGHISKHLLSNANSSLSPFFSPTWRPPVLFIYSFYYHQLFPLSKTHIYSYCCLSSQKINFSNILLSAIHPFLKNYSTRTKLIDLTKKATVFSKTVFKYDDKYLFKNLSNFFPILLLSSRFFFDDKTVKTECKSERKHFSLYSEPSNSSSDPLIITIKLPISFSNGYFSLRFGSNECLFHFWSPIQLALKMLQEELIVATNESENINGKSFEDYGSNKGSKLKLIDQLEIEFDPFTTPLPHPELDNIKFGHIEMVAEHNDTTNTDFSISHSQLGKAFCKNRYRLARLMPFGFALLGCKLEEVYFVGTGTGEIKSYQSIISKPLKISFKLFDKTKTLKSDIVVWHEKNPLDSQTMLFKTNTIDPNLFEQNELVVRVYWPYKNHTKTNNLLRKTAFQILQQERKLLLKKFNPLQQEFVQIVQSAKKESRRKFKFGGLFLLSAQLGFVGRLTYFEYSWDIMEPVTWIMTYATMVGSFAYYIITSEEYVVPMVEKRMIASRFWKLAQSRQFDVQQYKQLKDELKQIDERIGKLRIGF